MPQANNFKLKNTGNTPQKEPAWALYAAGLVIFIVILQFFRSYYFPQFIDEYFHIHKAWSLKYHNGFPLTEILQAAPSGRPNLYPPLYHCLIYLIHQAGAGWILSAKILSVLIAPLFCLTFYLIFSKTISSRFGFIFVLLAFSNYGFFNSLINNTPATISIIFWGISFYFFLKEKYLSSALTLGLCFYTHPFLGYVEFITIFLWASCTKGKKSLPLLYALAAAAPFILLQFASLNSFSHSNIQENAAWEVKTAELILAAGGCAVFLREKEKNRVARLFFILVAVSIVIFLFSRYKYRLSTAQGFLPFLFFASYCLDILTGKFFTGKIKMLAAPVIAISFLFLNPTIVSSREKISIKPADSFFVNSLSPLALQRPQGLSIWFPQFYRPVAYFIRENSAKDDIVSCNAGALGVMFSFLSERPTSSYMFQEIKPYAEFDQYEVSSILIYLKYLNREKDAGEIRSFLSRGFILAAETPMFCLLRNPAPVKNEAKHPGSKAVVNINLIIGSLLFISAVIIRAAFNKPFKRR